MKNVDATMHYLTPSDKMFFANLLLLIRERIERIKRDNELIGNWGLSEDPEWIVKLED